MEFKIVQEKNCPLYSSGERMRLSHRTFAAPQGKEVCLILARDMTELLFRLGPQGMKEGDTTEEPAVHNCSGCTGLIKFRRLREEELGDEDKSPSAPGSQLLEVQGNGPKMSIAKSFRSTLLAMMTPEEVEAFLAHCQRLELEPGTVLIHKNEKNVNLYMVEKGCLGVVDNGVHLAKITAGELCGEMSYLGADTAVSSVIALEQSSVFGITGEVFGQLFGQSLKVQNYMAKLLASRLRRTNEARLGDFEACMSGRLEEILPAELLQVFHMHQKTGVLRMDFGGHTGKVSFREGCIINAEKGDLANEDAIFSILGERKGVYTFTSGLSPKDMRAAEIGDFMQLLMEGVKRVDEELGEDAEGE